MRKMMSVIGAAALLVTVVGAVALLSGSPAGAQSITSLEGVQWSLVSYVDTAGDEAEVLPETRITAQFGDGRVAGTAGCNAYSAPYEAKGGKISVGSGVSTMMMCSPQAVMDQESAYLKALRAAASYKIDGDRLTMSDAKGATLLTYQAEEPGTLTGGAWTMTMYNNGRGGFQSAQPDVQVTAVFDEEGKLSGFGGCNNYFAQYKVDGEEIEIGPVGSTRMACPQPVMDQETAYFRALESAATFKIDGNRLMLRTADDASAVEFRRQEEPAAKPTAAPQAAPTSGAAPKAKLENVYVGLRPAADGPVQSLALNLQPDGTAVFTRDFGKETSIVETGAWAEAADGTLTITLTDKDGKKVALPSVLKFKRDGTYLNLVDYDKAVWGESGLKLNLAADVARKVRSAMVTIDLAAGFPLDPTFVSVNGGGEVDARLLSNKCSGYIHRQPVVTVNWSGEADMARIFYYSSGDPTLVVLTPEGELLCNDNANPQLRDPVVEIAKPAAGQYRIWVGSAAKNQLIPGVLVLTTKPNVDLGTFDLGKLIQRPSIPQKIEPSAPVTVTAQVQALADRALKTAPALQPGADITVDVTAEGIVPLFKIPAAANNGCAGLVTGVPSYAFNWSGAAENLHIAFEGDGDSTLMVVNPDKKLVLCNDDAQAGSIHPAIDIPEPADGTYLVFVGRVSPAKPVKGTLTVTEAPAR